MWIMAATANSPIGRLFQRHAESAIREALQDTRVVLVNGARQSGKSTLLRQIARADAVEWRDLDSPVIRQAALTDPSGFVDYQDMMVIDEIQRVPELLLPIKVQVDNDARPGRYLLSGSARVLGLRGLPDTLPAGWRPSSSGRSRKGRLMRRQTGLLTRYSRMARTSGMRPRSAGPSTPTGSCAAAPRSDSAVQPAAPGEVP